VFAGTARTQDAVSGYLTKDEAAKYVEPPYTLGETTAPGAWELINLDGRVAGYGFESEPLAPLPGFSGAPINMFVQITVEGRFIDVKLIRHNEPIFVSGLGEAPFRAFMSQYKGLSITDSLVVGVPYGGKNDGSSLVYLDGVTKATASVRIAHESILAAAQAIAREKMQGLGSRSAARPNPDINETLNWADMVEQGIAVRRLVTNAEVQGAFAGTKFADDDPEALENPQAAYLDLWVVDLGPPSVAAAVLEKDTLAQLNRFLSINPESEPVLVIDAGRHGLVTEEFIRNTSPDLLSAEQGGLPVALRDADLLLELKPDVPQGAALILRTDRRLGFNPAAEWTLTVRALRAHGSFQPELGHVDLAATIRTPERFFLVDEPIRPDPLWLQAIKSRIPDLTALMLLIAFLFVAKGPYLGRLAALPNYRMIRYGLLAVVTGFVGWWGQGQLSIVTVLGVVRGVIEGADMSFLFYDAFSLVIWITVIVSFFLWGRALFCGWLCPFGAMQEFADAIGRALRLPQVQIPARFDGILVNLKYVVLAALVATAITHPALNDKLIEVEPFKTAVTTYFVREWYFVAYAAGLLLSSMVLFKGFCRYLCPLGAFMAIGGMLRGRDWIARRAECGSPCQLCKVKCSYKAIKPSGAIAYNECFGCLDCVRIHDDVKQCVPLVLKGKGRPLPQVRIRKVPA
jgi:transcriptional regulator of nitric oxide reductase/ferredoxin